MGDYIIRVTAGNGSIRAFFADTRHMAEEARKIHGTSPVVTAALGRSITAAAMMGCMLKGDELLTLTLKGDGPMRGLTVTANSYGQVKAFPYEPIVDIPLKESGKLDVSGAIGSGTLSIIKDIGLKEPYAGQIELISGEIAEDLTYYYAKSEQTPTSVALGVLVDRDYSVKQSAGFMIQALPDAEDEILEMLENRLSSLRPLTALLEEGNTVESVMEALLGDLEILENERIAIGYHCNCNYEKVEKALISVGRDELRKILAEDGKANLHCHFCGKEYLFDEEALKRIIFSQ